MDIVAVLMFSGTPSGCNRIKKNVDIAIALCRMVLPVLSDAPPSVPPRDAQLVSVLTSRKRKPRREACRLERLRVRRSRGANSDGVSIGYSWDVSSEEGSVAQHTR